MKSEKEYTQCSICLKWVKSDDGNIKQYDFICFNCQEDKSMENFVECTNKDYDHWDNEINNQDETSCTNCRIHEGYEYDFRW